MSALELDPANRNPNFGWVRKNGRVVVDEMCGCGHPRSKHGGFQGHGACESSCKCSRFSWEKFVTITEKQFERLAKKKAEGRS